MSVQLALDQQLVRGFFLGDWEVRPLAGILRRNDTEKHLEPKVMDVLLCLARHQGEVVTRDMLLQEVWGKVIVSDDAITRCVSELRAVLGDTDRERVYIRTISRRGYSLLLPVTPLVTGPALRDTRHLTVINGALAEKTRDTDTQTVSPADGQNATRGRLFVLYGCLALLLIGTVWYLIYPGQTTNVSLTAAQQAAAPVSGTTQQAAQALRVPAAADPGSIRSLAVLPFVSLSGEAEHDLFADGLSEDIRNALMSFSDLRVAARTSSTVFKGKAMDVRDIAAQLNVDALLEGTVRISNGKLRITTQLTHGVDGYSVWASSYERSIDDKGELQTEVAGEIARQLGLSLQTVPGNQVGATSNVRAHDLYLLGRHHWHLRTAESLRNAEHYFNEALKLDPDYALALSGLADALVFQISYADRDLDEIRGPAMTALNTALELEPQLAEAHASRGLLLEKSGDLDGAKMAFERAVELKPEYSMAQMWLGNAWYDSREINRAFVHYEQALKVDPLHETVQYNYANALMGMGNYDRALSALERFSGFSKRDLLLKAELQARLSLGQYDKVLDVAVAHNYSGEIKPHADLAVIEALIQLGRLSEAAQMIEDNRTTMDVWPQGWLQASLSVARRDPPGLNEVADFFVSPGIEYSHKVTPECAAVMSVYLRGLAASLGGEHGVAEQRFNQFRQLGDQQACAIIEPEIRIAALLYQARSRMALAQADLPASHSLAEATTILQALRQLGWDSLTINTIDTALHLLQGDRAGALSLVRKMEERRWQPYGLMQSSPLFDDFLARNGQQPSLVRLRDRYTALQERCDVIGLAKLGL